MSIQTKKEKVHRVVIRDARNPTLVAPEDIFPSVFDNDVVLVYGSQSALGDFSPYYAIYKDLLGALHILKFSQTKLTLKTTCPDIANALEQALAYSLEDLATANTVLKSFGVSPMSLKCMVSKI